MLQNAYLLAKIGADAAENEQHFAEILPKMQRRAGTRTSLESSAAMRATILGGAATIYGAVAANAELPRELFTVNPGSGLLLGLAKLSNNLIGKFCKFFANFCKFLAGSFSAV